MLFCKYRLVSLWLFIVTSVVTAQASAGSLYLPLKLSPEIEARIERVFVLANMPIIKRPIPVKQLHEALHKAETADPRLVSNIHTYLERYTNNYGLTHVSVSVADSEDRTTHYIEANNRGFSSASNYTASFSGYAVLSDHIAMNIGGIAGERPNNLKDEFLEGSFVSVGWDYFQVDMGYRSHWWSPSKESAMLLSTNASALPSITLSNAKPLPFWDIQYELFAGQLSESDGILSQESREDGTRLTGNPRLFGMHLSASPLAGFAIGFNRVMQFGGADRDQGISDVFAAFTNVKSEDNIGRKGRDFGNQLSSITTSYTFTGAMPVSVYMEYAGEDTSFSSNVHLGNSALLLGIHLPKLTDTLDLTLETAEWQNAWYTNTNYADGFTHYGAILGHWGANHRRQSDAVHAQADTAKLIWDIRQGSALTLKFQQLENQETNVNTTYTKSRFYSAEYAQAFGNVIAGAKIIHGNTVFDESFSQISAFLRW